MKRRWDLLLAMQGSALRRAPLRSCVRPGRLLDTVAGFCYVIPHRRTSNRAQRGLTRSLGVGVTVAAWRHCQVNTCEEVSEQSADDQYISPRLVHKGLLSAGVGTPWRERADCWLRPCDGAVAGSDRRSWRASTGTAVPGRLI